MSEPAASDSDQQPAWASQVSQDLGSPTNASPVSEATTSSSASADEGGTPTWAAQVSKDLNGPSESAPPTPTPSAPHAPSTSPPHYQPSRFVQAAPPARPAQPNPQPPASAPELTWGQTAAGAVKNLVPSTAQGISAIWSAATHPLQTLHNIGQVAAGAGSQIAGALGAQQDPQQKAKSEALVKALEQHYITQYSSIKGFKQGLSTDPFGVAMDASLVADPAAGVLGKVGEAGKLGVLSDAANTASKVLPYVNPVRSALTVARAPGAALSAAARGIGSVTSRVPESALKLATQVGRDGDPIAQAAFTRFASGQGDATEVQQLAQQQLGQIKQAASNEYLQGKSQLLNQPVPLSGTYDALDKADQELGMGATSGFPDAKAAMAAARGYIDEFTNKADPTGQNVVQADALKKQMWDLQNQFPNSTAKQYLGQIYNGVKSDISAIDPTYADLMDKYQEGLRNINDLTKTLGLGNKAAATMALGKQLRTLKTGTGSNLLQQVTANSPALRGALAGAAISPWSNHSSLWEAALGGATTGLPSMMAHPLGALAAIPGIGAGLALSSPRVMGSIANVAGKISRPISALASPVAMGTAKIGYYASRPNEMQTYQDNGSPPIAPAAPEAPSAPGQPVKATPADVDAATRMVIGEAANQPDQGKAAALYTAINRSRASGKPLSAVIGQPNAYEAVTSGRTANIDPNSPEYKRIRDTIVLPALAGQLDDPTGGMTHFINKALQLQDGRKIPSWAQGDGLQIGEHTFYSANGGRIQRANGGSALSHEQLVDRLMKRAEQAKKASDAATKPLLNVPDNTVVKALDLAQRSI